MNALRTPKKEPWNFDGFTQAYNTIAEENGGYRFNNERTPEELAESYDTSIESTIRGFAWQIFVHLQRTN